MDPVIQRVVTRYKVAKAASGVTIGRAQMEPNVIRNAKAMLEEMQEAEAKMHRAEQFSRQLRMEPSLEWIADQLEETHKTYGDFVKATADSLEYLTRE